MGYQDPGQKQSAGDPNQREKEIGHLSQTGNAPRPYGEEIDEDAETQSQEKTDQFNHGPECSVPRGAPSIQKKRHDVGPVSAEAQ